MLLSGSLAALAAVLTARAPGRPLITAQMPMATLIAVIALLFLFAEQFLLSVEFRRQTHAATLAGVPLLLGVLLLAPLALVVTRVLASVIAFARQKTPTDKMIYNASAYAFEAALDTTLLHRTLGFGGHLTSWTGVGVLTVLAGVDQLMSLLVLVLIRLHNGPLTRTDVVEVLTPAIVLSVVASTFAFASLILVREGPFGVGLAVILASVGILAYREHASTRRRHQSLALVHELVTGGVGAETVDALATQLLAQIRQLLHAARVELLLVDDHAPGDHATPDHIPADHAPADHAPADSARADHQTAVNQPVSGSPVAERARPALVLVVDENDQLSVTQRDTDPTDAGLPGAPRGRAPILATRSTKDPGLQRWLDQHGRRDAMLVTLPESSGLRGTLTVVDRLGETATFGPDDLTLLETLAGHLAVAVRSTRLLEKLGYDATHDSLTGLANRSHLYQRIGAVLHQPAPQAAVLLLDLDRFKEVNDALGHDVGDRLLVVVADRLRTALPASATVARLGGDEFAILVPELSADTEDVGVLAERLGAELAKPVLFDEAMLTPEASIGVAVTTAGSRQTDLLRHADTAMYHAKTGNVRVAVFHPDMDRGRVERLALLADLRASLAKHPEQFVLHYQPKIDLQTGAVVSVEALVRWCHPTLGIIAPDQFIPVAESAGLIPALTPYVLTAALSESRSWFPGYGITVAVNLSARELSDPALPARVAHALDETGAPARSLILEITESSVMGDPAQTLPVLEKLQQLGVSLSLDDFGTGYSSLAYLQRLPVNEIKIDRSFVMGLNTHEQANSRALIRSIAGLGRNLGLRVVAEGIEDADTLDELHELGCEVGQGYHISRPLTASGLQSWLAQRSKDFTQPLQLVAGCASAADDSDLASEPHIHLVPNDGAPHTPAANALRLDRLA